MKKILLIEDDTDLFALLRYNLEKEGFSLAGKHTGKGAIELCRQQRPDLILLDIMLPDSDGLDICKGIRRDPRSEEHTSELQSLRHLVCRLLLEKKKPSSLSENCVAGGTGYRNRSLSQNILCTMPSSFFFFNDGGTPEIYFLPLPGAFRF